MTDAIMTRSLNRSTWDALYHAVNTDHPCNEVSCDIAAALGQDYPEVAGWLLTSATDELPYMDRFFAEHPNYALPNDLGNCEGWDEWLAFHRKHGYNCKACNSYNYATIDYRGNEDWRPTSCGDCHATLVFYPRTLEEYINWLNEVTGDIALDKRLEAEYRA